MVDAENASHRRSPGEGLMIHCCISHPSENPSICLSVSNTVTSQPIEKSFTNVHEKQTRVVGAVTLEIGSVMK